MWYTLGETVPAEENYAWANDIFSEHSCIYPYLFYLNLQLLDAVFICLKRGKSILGKGGFGFVPPFDFWSTP